MDTEKKAPVLTVVVPCYNESEVFAETSKRLTALVVRLISDCKVSEDSGILFVNDGSRDGTWELIRAEHEVNPHVDGVTLAKNSGHQNALIAGLSVAVGYSDATVTIDADLQDDENAISEMVDKYLCGCDIVYGVRGDRKSDTFFKRTTAQGFYRVMSAMGVETVYNHADYRLMSKRAVEALLKFEERSLFLRGIIPMLGFVTDSVEYSRRERFAGTSKYPLKKMLAFAGDGITSFSVKPLKLIGTTGACLMLLALIAAIVLLIVKPAVDALLLAVLLSVWFICGLLMFSAGVFGEYIGKIYTEVKARPRFFIEGTLLHRDK